MNRLSEHQQEIRKLVDEHLIPDLSSIVMEYMIPTLYNLSQLNYPDIDFVEKIDELKAGDCIGRVQTNNLIRIMYVANSRVYYNELIPEMNDTGFYYHVGFVDIKKRFFKKLGLAQIINMDYFRMSK